MYRIHFGESDSDTFNEALELSKLATWYQNYQREIMVYNPFQGEYRDQRLPQSFIRHRWHIAVFDDDQIDLMARFYMLVKDLPAPSLFGTGLDLLERYCISPDPGKFSPEEWQEIRRTVELIELGINDKFPDVIENSADLYIRHKIVGEWRSDLNRVVSKLTEEKYIDSIDLSTGKTLLGAKTPKDYGLLYKNLRIQIEDRKYRAAVETYYEILGDRLYDTSLHRELIYLKHLADIPLEGRDLIRFRTESSRTDLIRSHTSEYCATINAVLNQWKLAGLKGPLDILSEHGLDLDTMLERLRKQHSTRYIYLAPEYQNEVRDGNDSPVTIDWLGAGYEDPDTTKWYKCSAGKIFSIYPDLIQHCELIEAPITKRHFGVWTRYSPEFYQREVLEQGLVLRGIEVYRHNDWRQTKPQPDFTTVTQRRELRQENFPLLGIRYTGRQHEIEGQDFYEIDVIRRDVQKHLGNPFAEMIDEILREAENHLRSQFGLPRIGEGWISEMTLYNAVKEIMPDAQHLARPQWLTPQHLDIYIPSRKLAIEYQGKQHFEPVSYFGGEEALLRTKERDLRKKEKCKAQGVKLIYWDYDEPINEEMFVKKLKI
jgi:hypothetical protein